MPILEFKSLDLTSMMRSDATSTSRVDMKTSFATPAPPADFSRDAPLLFSGVYSSQLKQF